MSQGLVMGTALLVPRQKDLRQARWLLATLILLFTLIIGHACLALNDDFQHFPRLAHAIATLPLLIGPLLWLYLRSLLCAEPLSLGSSRHFLPFALALLAWTPIYFLIVFAPLAPLGANTSLPWYLAAFGLFKALHIGCYLLACHRLIARMNAALPEQVVLHQLRKLILALALGLSLAAILFAAESLDRQLPVSSDVWAAVVLTSFVYALAYYSMRLPFGYVPPGAPARVAESPFKPEERERLLKALQGSMEKDLMYCEGELSLEQLASHLGLLPQELSKLINQTFAVNFQEYLNGYRVTALKTALSAPENRDRNILDLALDAGFNSKSSLNRVFKNHTGMTPTQFRSAHFCKETQATI